MLGNHELRAQFNSLVPLRELSRKPEEVHGEAVVWEMYRDILTRKLHIIEYHSRNPLIAINPDGRNILQRAAANTLELKDQWEASGAHGVFRTELTRNINVGCMPIQTASDGTMYFLDIIKSYKKSDGTSSYALDSIAGGPNLSRDLKKAAEREFLEEALIWNVDNGLHIPQGAPHEIKKRLAKINKQVQYAQRLGLTVPDDFLLMLIEAQQRALYNDFSLICPVQFGHSPLPHLTESEITIVDGNGTIGSFDALTFFHSQGADAIFPINLPSGKIRTLDTETLQPPEEQMALDRQHALLTLENKAALLRGEKTWGIKVTANGSEEHTFDPTKYPLKPLGHQISRELLLM